MAAWLWEWERKQLKISNAMYIYVVIEAGKKTKHDCSKSKLVDVIAEMVVFLTYHSGKYNKQ